MIKEQSDQVIDLRTNEIELQYELKHNNLRNNVLEELRSEREIRMKKNLKAKIEKQLTEEMSKEITEKVEAEVREELTVKISEEMKNANNKEIG